MQGVDCSTTGRVVNVTVAVNVPQRGGNLTVDPIIKHPGASLGNLAELLNLFIANVNFSAPIPPEWGNLRNLVSLQLFGNTLTGELPTTLGKLTKIQKLIIDGAAFTVGIMPSSFCNMVSLITLEITGGLTSIPPCLSTSLKNLQELRLGNNRLKGPIPVWITYFPALTLIDLHGNEFTGIIPVAFGNMKTLQYLLLGANRLKGQIPPELGKLGNLVSMDLMQNLLTGPIPPQLSQLKNLTYISCQQNFITGPLPPELGSLPNLQTFDFYQNNITGSIPVAWANIGGSNPYIVLSYNDLTGMVSKSCECASSECSLKSKFSVTIETNSVVWMDWSAGTLPPELGKLKGGTLLLDHNKLTGGIPASYANLNSLVVDFNWLSDLHQIGPLVTTSQIFSLSAAGNKFAGYIPTWLSSFHSLHELDLSQNKFTGMWTKHPSWVV